MMIGRFTVASLLLALGATALGQPSTLKKEALAEVERRIPQIDEMSIRLWDLSETALKETRSVEFLSSLLEQEGFSVERGVADLPTAFVASYGSGKPVIGILAEYDALPGVGNQPVPEKKPRTDGVTSGQGCGHNLFGAASIGGALALKALMVKNNLPGTLKLFGSPAEETLVGKVYMARAGIFDGLDAVIVWHPAVDTEVTNQTGRAMNSFEVEFFGQAAHGSADPWNGRSALDAVEMMNFGANLMREHIKPTARIHYVIPNGGEAPNVVPEYARVWYYVRDINRTEVQRHYDQLLRIAEGAAMATKTTHKVHLIAGVHEYLLNRPLQEALQANLEMVGAPQFSESEQQFGKALQRFLGVEEKGFSTEIKKLADTPKEPEGGSSDVAEVSFLAPLGEFSIATAADGIPWHSWATTACHGMSAGRKGAVVAAKVIAAQGVDMLTRPELIEVARQYFDEATGGRPYESPVPLD